MKKQTQSKTEKPSRVAKRFSHLAGKPVIVRIRVNPNLPPEKLNATYLDTLPWGRPYFAAFETADGTKRLVQTEHILDLTEAQN